MLVIFKHWVPESPKSLTEIQTPGPHAKGDLSEISDEADSFSMFVLADNIL